jgi:hypothetical protein
MRSAALNRPGSRASSARPPPAPAPRSAGSSQGRDRRSLSRHVWRQATGVRRTLRAEARRWRPRAWRPVAPRLCFNSRRHDRLASVRDHDDITGLEVRRRVLEEAQVFAGLCRGDGRWRAYVGIDRLGGPLRPSGVVSRTPSRGRSARGRSERNRSPALRQRGSSRRSGKRFALELFMGWSDQPRCPAGSRIGPSC